MLELLAAAAPVTSQARLMQEKKTKRDVGSLFFPVEQQTKISPCPSFGFTSNEPKRGGGDPFRYARHHCHTQEENLTGGRGRSLTPPPPPPLSPVHPSSVRRPTLVPP